MLIDAHREQLVRLKELEPDSPRVVSEPNPGATEAQLEAMEGRLGRSLDPIYRSFLKTANGWPQFDGSTWGGSGSDRILGTEEFRTPRDEGLREWTQEFYAIVGERSMAELVTEFFFGADCRAAGAIIDVNGSGYRAGQTILFRSDIQESENFAFWFVEQTLSLSDEGQAILCSALPGFPDLAPPSGLIDLVERTIQIRAWWHEHSNTSYTPPNSGATEAELREVEQALGFPLAEEHKELLRIVNGCAKFYRHNDLLSTHEIADKARWGEAASYAADGAVPLETESGAHLREPYSGITTWSHPRWKLIRQNRATTYNNPIALNDLMLQRSKPFHREHAIREILQRAMR